MKEFLRNPSLFFVAISIIVTFTNFFGNIAIALILLITDIVILGKDGIKVISHKSFFFLFCSYFIVIIYSSFGYGNLTDDSFKGWLFNCIILASTFIISSHIRRFNSKGICYLLFISISSILICTLITIYIGISNPMAVRLFGMGEFSGSAADEANLYKSMGMMSYASAHAIAVLSVGITLLLCYSSKQYIRIISIVTLILMLILQFTMTITTALLVSAICCSLIVVNKLSKGKIVISMLLVFLVLIFIVYSGAVISFLNFANSSNTEIFAKLYDLFISVESGTGSGQMGYRESLYSVSFYSFLQNPIFGLAVDDGSRAIIGQHSFLLDNLAFYGIFALLYFYAWWNQFNYALDVKKSKHRIIYYLVFLPVVLLIVLKAESVASQLPFSSLVFIQIVFRYLRYKETLNI